MYKHEDEAMFEYFDKYHPDNLDGYAAPGGEVRVLKDSLGSSLMQAP
jgi:hypothetical protein